MDGLSKSIIAVALVSVGVVLMLGLINMARGGSMNTSQKLMRWRVFLQFIAICIIMAAVWLSSH